MPAGPHAVRFRHPLSGWAARGAGAAGAAPAAAGKARLSRRMVPETGIEPVRLAARDFRTTSAFAASARAVRGLEHAFTIALRPQVPAVCSLHLPGFASRAWLGVG